MSNKEFNIDDPRMVNSFLAVMHGAQTLSPPGPNRRPASDLSPVAAAFEPETPSNGLPVGLYLSATFILKVC